VASSFEQDNETPGSISGEEFLENLHYFSRRILAMNSVHIRYLTFT
jgi:hypothetical protein